MLCPRCQTENPAQARFCMNCGEPVLSRTPADQARFARLAASTPEPLQRKLRTAVIQSEVRQVTVLLVDVVASTRLAEQLEPETYAVVINAAFDRIAPLVYRYEGTIARLLGDSLLALFGAPV
ncbi:MAG: zinc-ribbon domain-containing protein, partial [Anaerolineales bacterium]